MRKLIFIGILLLITIFLQAQTEEEKGLATINVESVKGQLEFLASDWTEGRAVGTKGAYLAADYIASVFKMYGVKAFGDKETIWPSREERMSGKKERVESTYYQNFSLVEYEPGEEQTFSVLSNTIGSESSVDFGYHTDFSVRTGSIGLSAKAPLVFVGYGYTNEEKGYNDLKKVDLKGKIAVVLNGFPGHNNPESEAYKACAPEGRYAIYRLERNKLENLEKEGVVAIIQVSPGSDPTLTWSQNSVYQAKGSYYEADKRLSSYYDKRMALPEENLNGNVPVFTVTERVANEIIAGTGINFKDFEKKVAGKMEPASQDLTGKWVGFKTTVISRIVKARNVLGYIEGEDTSNVIVVGGHYDHLGKYDGWVWNGADDNASGTVGVMSIARAIKATGKKPKKSIVFAAWTGEEKGLFGSKYFVKNVPGNKNVVLNLNYDMIGRDTKEDSLKNMASMVYTKANSKIEEVTQKNLLKGDINLNLKYRPSEEPGGGSDHAPFAQEGIPVFYFMAAMHPDYHQPSDELSKINWEKMTDIIKIGFLDIWEFANDDSYLIPEDKLDGNK